MIDIKENQVKKKRNPLYNPDMKISELFFLTMQDIKEKKLFWRTIGVIFLVSLAFIICSLTYFIPYVGKAMLLFVYFLFMPMLLAGYFRYLLNALNGKGDIFQDAFYLLARTKIDFWLAVGFRYFLIAFSPAVASLLLLVPNTKVKILGIACVLFTLFITINNAMFLPLVSENPDKNVKKVRVAGVKGMNGNRLKFIGCLLVPALIMSGTTIVSGLLMYLAHKLAVKALAIIIFSVVAAIYIVASLYVTVVTTYMIPEFYLTHVKEFEELDF